jgi:uncharacterized membrane protein YfcA
VSRARRLAGFVRPYGGAFGAGVAAAVLAAVLDGLTFALLIPFLRILFGLAPTATVGTSAIERVLVDVLGGWLSPERPLAALRNVVLVLLGVIVLKNVAVYAAGYLRAHVQESVARDLRLAL